MNINLRPTLYKDLTVEEAVTQGYLQDIVVEYNGVQFRTCSKFVTTELERELDEIIFIDHLYLM